MIKKLNHVHNTCLVSIYRKKCNYFQIALLLSRGNCTLIHPIKCTHVSNMNNHVTAYKYSASLIQLFPNCNQIHVITYTNGVR